MKVRLSAQQDTEQLAQLFHETVREFNIRDYSIRQVKAWAPNDIHFRNWSICSNQSTYVADEEGIIIEFGELESNGHIACFYCHKNYQRRGLGRQIYQAIESKAVKLRLNRLFTASITRPFF